MQVVFDFSMVSELSRKVDVEGGEEVALMEPIIES